MNRPPGSVSVLKPSAQAQSRQLQALTGTVRLKVSVATPSAKLASTGASSPSRAALSSNAQSAPMASTASTAPGSLVFITVKCAPFTSSSVTGE